MYVCQSACILEFQVGGAARSEPVVLMGRRKDILFSILRVLVEVGEERGSKWQEVGRSWQSHGWPSPFWGALV